MPFAPDIEDFKIATQNKKLKQAVTPPKKNKSVKDHSHLPNTVMRNWVIMSLCGFNSVLLNMMPIHFPDFTDDFLELSQHIDQIVGKLRLANHK